MPTRRVSKAKADAEKAETTKVDTEKVQPAEDQKTPEQENETMPDPDTGLANDDENIGERAHGHSVETAEDLTAKSSVTKRSAPTDGFVRIKGAMPENRVALMEVNKLHPNGEVFVVGTAEADVWLTQNVADALRLGRITRV